MKKYQAKAIVFLQEFLQFAKDFTFTLSKIREIEKFQEERIIF
jgi:hypothetical protein